MKKEYILVFVDNISNYDFEVENALKKFNYNINDYLKDLTNNQFIELLEENEIGFENDYSYKDLEKLYFHNYYNQHEDIQSYQLGLHGYLIQFYQYNPITKEYGKYYNKIGMLDTFKIINRKPVNIQLSNSIKGVTCFIYKGKKYGLEMLEIAKKQHAYIVEINK